MWNLFDKLWKFYDKNKSVEKLELENNFEHQIKNKELKIRKLENEKLKNEITNLENVGLTDLQEKKQQKELQNKIDVEIVRLILAGNTDLFEKILDNYQQQILIYCTQLLNWHTEDGKDATSSTFVKAYVNLASFNPKLQFSSWLYRIAHNEAINKIKQNSKHFSFPLDKFVEKNGENDTFDTKNFNQTDNQANEFAISKTLIFEEDKRIDLDNVLGQLNSGDKNILLLFYVQELSLEQIGEILKITTNNAKVRLFRARDKAKKLAQKL